MRSIPVVPPDGEVELLQQRLVRLQSELERTRAALRAVVAASRAPVLVTDPASGSIIDSNPAANRFYGYGRERLCHMRVGDIAREGWPATDERSRARSTVMHHRLANGEVHQVMVTRTGSLFREGKEVECCIIQEIGRPSPGDKVLYRGEAMRRAIVDFAGIGIAATDLNGRILTANHALERKLGYERGGLVGLRWQDITTGEGEAEHARGLRRLLTGEKTHYHLEEPYRRKDGSTMWGRFTGSVAESDDGGPIMCVCLVEDVTERRATRSQLAQSRYLLEATFASLDDAILTVDAQTRHILSCNAAAERLFGYPREELLGRDTEFLHVNRGAYEQFGRETSRELAAGGMCRTEFRMRRSDATVFVSEHTVTLAGANGGMVVSVVRDVTERRAAQDRLRQANERLDAIIAASPLAVVSLDGDLVVRSWNRAAEAMFGHTEAEAVGSSLPALLHHPPEPLLGLFEPVLQGRTLSGVQMTMGRRGSSDLHLRLSAAPLHGTAGEVTGMVVLIGDVTHDKQLEEALRQAEERDELLASQVGDIVLYRCRVLPEPRLEYVSRAAERLTGYDVAQLMGDPSLLPSMLHPDDRVAADLALRSGASSREAVVLRWQRRDGSLLWTEVRCIPVRDDGGALIAVEGVARDVTRRKQAEARIARAEEGLVPLLLMEIGPDGHFTFDWASEQAPGLLGYARGSRCPSLQEWIERLSPEDLAAVQRAIHAAAFGRAAQVEVRRAEGGRIRLRYLPLPGNTPQSHRIAVSAVGTAAAEGGGAAPAEPALPAKWRRLTLEFPAVGVVDENRPSRCPHCGHELLQRHQVVRRRLRDLPEATAEVVRYLCLGCRRTFSHHPAGVGRDLGSDSLRLAAVALYGMGFSIRKVSRLLAGAGIEWAARTVWRHSQGLGERMRQSRPPNTACLEPGERRPAGKDLIVAEEIRAGGPGSPVCLVLRVWEQGDGVSSWLRERLAPWGVRLSCEEGDAAPRPPRPT